MKFHSFNCSCLHHGSTERTPQGPNLRELICWKTKLDLGFWAKRNKVHSVKAEGRGPFSAVSPQCKDRVNQQPLTGGDTSQWAVTPYLAVTSPHSQSLTRQRLNSRFAKTHWNEALCRRSHHSRQCSPRTVFKNRSRLLHFLSVVARLRITGAIMRWLAPNKPPPLTVPRWWVVGGGEKTVPLTEGGVLGLPIGTLPSVAGDRFRELFSSDLNPSR